MKMNKPYIEIVRFDAEDVIATSGVVNCAVSPLHSGDKILHYNHQDKNYFVYDYAANTNTSVTLDGQTKLSYNGQETYNTGNTAYNGSSSTTGLSAYLYKDSSWYWWDDDYGLHGDY